MKTLKRALFSALLSACLIPSPALSQTSQCTIAGTLSATGFSNVVNNLSSGCYGFRVSYASTGFSALSIQLEYAPNNGGSSGTYAAFSGAAVTDGSNPSTSLQGTIGIHGAAPFYRLHLTSVTGTGSVQFTVFGTNGVSPSSSSNSSGGSGPLIQVNGTNAGSQSTLNLAAGSNMAITDGGSGTITFASSGGGGGSPNWLGLINFTAPPTTGWTWDNQGTCTVDNNLTSTLYLRCPPVSVGSTEGSFYYRTAPGTPYHLTVCFTWEMSNAPPSANTNYTGTASSAGIAFRDSSGKLEDFVISIPGVTQTLSAFYSIQWNSSTSQSSSVSYNPQVESMLRFMAGEEWLQIGDDGTNIIFSWSIDGTHWQLFHSESRTTWFASGPTQIAVELQTNQSTVNLSLLSWAIS